MKKCPFCGRPVESGAVKCPHCDAALTLVLTPAPRQQTSWLPIVAAIAVIAILAGAAIQFRPQVPPPQASPSVAPSTQLDQKTICANNLRDIGVALSRFAHDHHGRYPERLGELIPLYLKHMPSCPTCSDPNVYAKYYQSPDKSSPDGAPIVVDRCDAWGHLLNVEGRGLIEAGPDDHRSGSPEPP